MTRSSAMVALFALATACGDSADTNGTGGVGGPDPGTAGTGGAFLPRDSYELKWAPVEVPGETESTQCVVKRLGNPAGTFVHEIHNVLGATSHHFIVY